MHAYALVLLLLGIQAQEAGLPPAVTQGSVATSIELVEGPVVLSKEIELQWGGQSFSYLLEGETGIFWTGLAYVEEDEPGRPLVGQAPKSGSELKQATTVLEIADEDVRKTVPPLLVRSPDGYLHVFVGYYVGDPLRGRVAYFRSARPEDAGAFVDRSELVPRGDFACFQTRMNVALAPDGETLVWQILSCFERGRHVINIPLILLGHRDGRDFRFDPPVPWGEPRMFFYPLVAATELGIVMVGAVSNEADTHRNAELVQLDWNLEQVYAEALPHLDPPGSYFAHALQPADLDDWSRLVLARSQVPREGTVRHIEFWTYDVAERKLELARAIENDFSQTRSITNAGELLPLRGRAPVFVNNPASNAIALWEGDLLGKGALRVSAIEATQPARLECLGTRSIYLPNVFQGSVPSKDGFYVAADLTPPTKAKRARGPCWMAVWRFRWKE